MSGGAQPDPPARAARSGPGSAPAPAPPGPGIYPYDRVIFQRVTRPSYVDHRSLSSTHETRHILRCAKARRVSWVNLFSWRRSRTTRRAIHRERREPGGGMAEGGGRHPPSAPDRSPGVAGSRTTARCSLPSRVSSSRACTHSPWSARRPAACPARRPARSPSCSAPRRTSGSYRPWAELLKRTFDVDVLS
jgi:hypothetical protein